MDWEVERGGGERVGRRAAATTSSASSTVINFMVAVFIDGESRRDNVGDERRTYDTGTEHEELTFFLRPLSV